MAEEDIRQLHKKSGLPLRKFFNTSGQFYREMELSKKRGLDPEIAFMAAMLHDLHAYKTGSYDDHAHLGADLAREIKVHRRSC